MESTAAAVEIHRGYMTDEVFNNMETCIAYAVNCISCTPYGIAQDVVDKYPQASAYKRTQLYNLKRCVPEDRPKPGTIHINRGGKNPSIVALASQYGIGYPIEKNEIGRLIINKSKDYSMVKGLREDTGENRVLYFTQCLEDLTEFVEGAAEINQVVLPWGIGMSCVRCDEEWENMFLPIIQKMERSLKPYNVKVILVKSKRGEKKEVVSNSA